MLQVVYMDRFGFSFKLSDVLNIQQFIATAKILFINSPMPTKLLIQGISLIVVITIAMYILNKWSTIYDMKERATGAIIGCVVLVACFIGMNGAREYAKQNNFTTFDGITSQLILEIKDKNTYSEDFLKLVDKEFVNFGWKEITPEGQEPTVSPTESTPTESTDATESTQEETTPNK